MSTDSGVIKEIHWLMDVLQSIDVGLMVIDSDCKLELWNRFMQNHSNLSAEQVLGKTIFELFPDIPEVWFKQKVTSVFTLNSATFTSWEQRPYLLKFEQQRPITGASPTMYQNSTFIPLIDAQGKVQHVCIIIYDVTDEAINKAGMEDANRQLKELSITDRLTNLFNRGYWEERAIAEFKRYKRYGTTCSLLIFDIDHFKKVNDTYGHQTGDEVIKHTSNMLAQSLRESDIAGRYGGEEFTILLTDTDSQEASKYAERLRKMIEDSLVEYDGHKVKYTISLGVAQIDGSMTDHKAWIEAADQALYACKHGGRNQWQVYTQDMASKK